MDIKLDDIKELAKDLMQSMEEQGVASLGIKKGDFEIQLERESSAVPQVVDHSAAQMLAMASSHFPPPAAHVAHAMPSHLELGSTPVKAESGPAITSPVVGTFYWAAAPGEPNFVKVGDTVSEDTIVGIVEAMKVMNEVKAGQCGVIAEVLVEDAHPVEFGTKIFRLES